jgi:hypothetical protein
MPKPRPDRWLRRPAPRSCPPETHATAPTACLALADGTLFYGHGFGATGMRVAELCFNTAMTGYQEIMTDPSYAGQIVTFTFPHIGNVGVNPEDDETGDPVAEGMVVKWDPTEPSNWRATGDLVSWLERTGRVGIGGLDTRRLTRAIRQQGAPHVALAHDPEGKFDLEALVAAARGFQGAGGRGPRQGRVLHPELPLGRDALGLARGLFPPARGPRAQGRGARLRRETQHPALPRQRGLRRDRHARHHHGRGGSGPERPTASSCPTVPAIRRPPATTPCR